MDGSTTSKTYDSKKTTASILLNSQDSKTSDVPASRPKVLVFGGNGFIGSELVNELLKSNNYEIFIVSRGNWYFDSEERIKPYVQHIICDRENSDLEFCTELIKLIESTEHFEYVFDFSAYRSNVLQESLDFLNNKTGLYILISSDSIYEVCEDRSSINAGLSREIDALRPDDELLKRRLNELDEYGDEKLECEEVLISNREIPGGIPYLIVRLPDVIGPRDTTDRIWTYIMWIQFFDAVQVPLFIPTHLMELKTSYVYVKDVVKALFHLIHKGFKDEVFNIAFDQHFTLYEFLKVLSEVTTGIEFPSNQIKFQFSAPESFNLFPSVTKGPIDISKLKATGFTPTNFKEALNETVMFYKDAFFTAESERDDVVHQLTKYVIGRKRKGEFLKFIDDLALEKKTNDEGSTQVNTSRGSIVKKSSGAKTEL